jgi:hypothetical protein
MMEATNPPMAERDSPPPLTLAPCCVRSEGISIVLTQEIF